MNVAYKPVTSTFCGLHFNGIPKIVRDQLMAFLNYNARSDTAPFNKQYNQASPFVQSDCEFKRDKDGNLMYYVVVEFWSQPGSHLDFAKRLLSEVFVRTGRQLPCPELDEAMESLKLAA
jgi:hypothetical protein